MSEPVQTEVANAVSSFVRGKRVAIINKTGNVGKSTIFRHIRPMMPAGTKTVAIDPVNAGDGSVDHPIRAEEFLEMIVLIQKNPGTSYLLDIGSSQNEMVVDYLSRQGPFTRRLDAIIIPTVSKPKQIKDTVDTIRMLVNDAEVDPSRIYVVFNQVPALRMTHLENNFLDIFDLRKEIPFNILPGAITENELYDLIKSEKRTIFDFEALNKAVDWDEASDAAAVANDQALVEKIAVESTLCGLAVKAARNFREVFSACPVLVK